MGNQRAMCERKQLQFPDTIDTIYRIILSANQLSIYSAVAAICEEYEDHPDSTGEPVILEGQ